MYLTHICLIRVDVIVDKLIKNHTIPFPMILNHIYLMRLKLSMLIQTIDALIILIN